MRTRKKRVRNEVVEKKKRLKLNYREKSRLYTSFTFCRVFREVRAIHNVKVQNVNISVFHSTLKAKSFNGERRVSIVTRDDYSISFAPKLVIFHVRAKTRPREISLVLSEFRQSKVTTAARITLTNAKSLKVAL